jgi:excisionase family DNA binding protein
MRETQQTLGVTHALVYRLVMSGELRSITIGSRRLVPVRELEAFITHRLVEEYGEP